MLTQQTGKIGVGVQVEIQNEEVMLQQERLMKAGTGIPLPPIN